jgi:hypothetical protein
MPHDTRWPAWTAVALGLLVLLLVLHVATPRVRLTSAEHLGLSTPTQPATHPRSGDDEAESLDDISSSSVPPTPQDLP